MVRAKTPDLQFAGIATNDHMHGVHPYPARMPPSLANYLIRKASPSKGLVFDPFCGSGTTLLETKLLGRDSLGMDINPLAVLISRLKVNPPSVKEIAGLGKLVDQLHSDTKPTSNDTKLVNRLLRSPLVSYWFHPSALHQLVCLRTDVIDNREFRKARIKNLLLVAFSNTVRLSSEIRTDEYKLYRKNGDQRRRHRPNVRRIFLTELERVAKKTEEYWNRFPEVRLGNPKVICGDSTRKIPEGEIGAIVSSPPYGDHQSTVAYGQFSRLPLTLLGFQADTAEMVDQAMYSSLRPNVIEEVLNSSGTLCDLISRLEAIEPKRMRDVLAYFCMVNQTLTRANAEMANKATIALVVGERTVKSIRVPTPRILSELACTIGFRRVLSIDRILPRKMLPKRNGLTDTINKETILLFRR